MSENSVESIYHINMDRVYANLENNESVSKRNKKIIKEYADSTLAMGHSSIRVGKCMRVLVLLSKMLKKDFDKVDKKDIIKLMGEIESNRKWKDWTKADYKIVLKTFYKHMNGGEEYPDFIKFVKTTVKNRGHKLPEDMLTEGEVQKLIDTCDHPRDKAIISTIYEGGVRIGELLSIKMKNVQFDENGVVVVVDGKTGMRRVRLVSSAAYITNWLSIHPHKNEREAPLWVSYNGCKKGQLLSYMSVRKLFRTLGKRAGINKAMNPHNFRHSRATFLANRLTESQMKEYLGWTQGSEMAGIYVHLSGRNVDDAILGVYGILPREESLPKNGPVRCVRCKEANGPNDKFCSKCGMPMTQESAEQLDKVRETSQELMLERIKKLEHTMESRRR